MSRQASTGVGVLTFGGFLRRTYFFTNPEHNLAFSSQDVADLRSYPVDQIYLYRVTIDAQGLKKL
ncbi:hypothetical protein N8854_00265 [Porticoccaceae bacterium]|nr:hypothetical protein [Porticoccaceae bacterium]